MYDELKAKCEALRSDLVAVTEDLKGPLNYQELQLSQVISAAARDLGSVINCISLYFEK